MHTHSASVQPLHTPALDETLQVHYMHVLKLSISRSTTNNTARAQTNQNFDKATHGLNMAHTCTT